MTLANTYGVRALPSRSRRWPASASPSRWEYLPPVVLLVLGSVLLLRGHPLWFDEMYTAEVVQHSVPEIVRAIVEGRGTTSYLEDVPPSYNAPYYLVVKVWVALPFIGGDQSLRVLSLLAAAAGVAVLPRAVSRLNGPVTGAGPLRGGHRSSQERGGAQYGWSCSRLRGAAGLVRG